MTSQLDVAAFRPFFEAVHRHDLGSGLSHQVADGRLRREVVQPFPWQERLVRSVAKRGMWPRMLDLPTGAGKTAVLEVAVFLLALDAQRGLLRLPRRTVLVVDRRIVVDQAASAGATLLRALREPKHPVLAAVAEALRGLSGSDDPLICGTLRGGMVRDERWARRPDVPALLSGTVDQIGSRLLFRGYGVSDWMRPVHAGLLGCDTLIVLDEVHLSQPFAETLGSLDARYRKAEGERLPRRWQVVEMSATPGPHSADTFGLEPDEDLDPVRSPVLRRRITARKPVTMREVADRDPGRGALAAACADAAVELVNQTHVRTVGVVVNRVETARAAVEVLQSRHGLPTLLLTGRMRPFDRDDRLHDCRDRLRTGREPRDDGTPLIVVGTQCIEAGADFDFDALVTECASLDALRQRFGRVDRDGRLSAAGTPAPGVILALPGDITAGQDPVYGPALAATWKWLLALDNLDFGVARLPAADPELLPTLLTPRDRAPLLFPAHLDAWVQTSPAPEPDPDIALWLHGLRPASTDVHVVWRADLSETLLAEAAADDRRRDDIVALVEACPPGSAEAATVPISSVRRWLWRVGPDADGVADVDGAAVLPDEDDGPGGSSRPFVRWRGDDSTVSDRPASLAPGDVVVVPATYGGLTEESWNPEATEPVTDFGHRTQLQRRRVVLRLIPWVCRPVAVPDPTDEHPDPVGVVRAWLHNHGDELEDRSGREAARLLAAAPSRLHVQRLRGPIDGHQRDSSTDENGSTPAAAQDYFVCSAFIDRAAQVEELEGEAGSEPATSPFAGPMRVTLDAHLVGVGDVAASMARNCGLPDPLGEDLRLAGRLHDIGKLDPRFQRWLQDGDELAAAMADMPLAKSTLPRTDRRRRELARRQSGYPKDARHELLSVGLVQDQPAVLDQANDPDLVLHLIASHHGFCRPFAPVVPDPSPQPVSGVVLGQQFHGTTEHGLERLDSGISDRFWRLVEQYGWFGLAWLEAILRLADHRRSELEQLDKRTQG